MEASYEIKPGDEFEYPFRKKSSNSVSLDNLNKCKVIEIYKPSQNKKDPLYKIEILEGSVYVKEAWDNYSNNYRLNESKRFSRLGQGQTVYIFKSALISKRGSSLVIKNQCYEIF